MATTPTSVSDRASDPRLRAIEDLVRALGRTAPADLLASVAQLARSAWPEVVDRWSRLTPTGFPIELTVADSDSGLRWTTEIAGPEVADARRLDLVALRLAAAKQPISPQVLAALQSMQQGRELGYGAWLGGRAIDGAATRFKLYGEIPLGVSLHALPLPPALREAAAHAPLGTLPRMIGVEPARDRIELYSRLPSLAPEDLRPLLRAAGHDRGLSALERGLPGGARRLAGRRIGVSLAVGAAGAIDVALFVSARSLFPAAPEVIRRLVPAIARVPAPLVTLGLVTLGLDPAGEGLSFAVGATIPRPARSAQGLNRAA